MLKTNDLEKIWQQVPPDYYEKGVTENILQWWWHGQKINTFQKLVDKKNPPNILDVGCAGGMMTYKISQLLPASQITGIDVYDKAIQHAKKKYPRLKFIVCDAHRLPFKDNTFDLVICYETIEHVVKPETVLSEIRRVMKKNGIAIVTMDSGSLLFRIVWWFWERTRGKVWQGAHLHPFHHQELGQLIKKTKFKILQKHFSHLGMEVSFILTK
ncbi:class I SAM-dependent methyltransferase [Candidatus Microgenomates bacterium]|nr:class I SAM-dependent methyltransferase [Candidatus Microgenomates bacterium]